MFTKENFLIIAISNKSGFPCIEEAVALKDSVIDMAEPEFNKIVEKWRDTVSAPPVKVMLLRTFTFPHQRLEKQIDCPVSCLFVCNQNCSVVEITDEMVHTWDEGATGKRLKTIWMSFKEDAIKPLFCKPIRYTEIERVSMCV